MPVASYIKETMNSKGASVIRKMFEEGAVLRKKYGDDKVFDFSIGNPDLEPPKEVCDAVKEIAADETKGRHGYMPNAGYPEARSAMAEKVSLEQGLCGSDALTFENVVMSVGAASALTTVFRTILNPMDEVIVPAPFFAEYGHYVRNFQGKLVPVMTKSDFSLDIDAIENAMNERTAAVLINSPNNPSGKIYSDEEIENLSKAMNRHAEKTGRKPYLICDEPYRAIVYNGKKVSAAFKYYDEAVVVSSFAKNLSLPGERIGYIAVNPKAADAKEFIAACIFCTRTLGYVNAPAFFQKVVAKAWNADVDYSSYAKRCEQIKSVVKNAGIEFNNPDGAFYLFCKVPAKKDNPDAKRDDFEFCDHLKKYCILTAPGTGFGCPGYFRISYCVSEKTILNSEEAFKEAVKNW